MRYCPNCEKEVKTHLTAGQVALTIFLWIVCLPIGILYSCLHSRKCPSCGCKTYRNK